MYKHLIAGIILSLLLTKHVAASQETIIFGGNITTDIPPFSWVDKCTGEMDGVNYHLIRNFFEQQKIKIKISSPLELNKKNWGIIQQQLDNNEIDGLTAFYNKNSELLTVAKEPHMVVNSSLFYNKIKLGTLTNLFNFKDLRGLIPLTTPKFSTQPTYLFAKSAGLNVEKVNSTAEGFRRIIDGEADYLFTTHYYGRTTLANNPQKELFDYYKIPEMAHSYYLALKPSAKTTDILEKWSQYIIEYKKSGVLKFLNNSYATKWLKQKTCEK